MRKTRKYDVTVTARVKKTAELTGFTEDYVNRVLGCDRTNEEIMEVYMELEEREEELFKTMMHQQVNKLVPIPIIKRNTDKKHGESARKRTENAENV